MSAILARIGFAFIDPRTALVAWGSVFALCAVGYGLWSWTTIGGLRKEQAAIVERNDRLATANKDLIEDQADILNRVEAMNVEVEVLNSKFGQSITRRQRAYESLTTPDVPPGVRPDTLDMESRANAGMNQLFDELRSLSAVSK